MAVDGQSVFFVSYNIEFIMVYVAVLGSETAVLWQDRSQTGLGLGLGLNILVLFPSPRGLCWERVLCLRRIGH